MKKIFKGIRTPYLKIHWEKNKKYRSVQFWGMKYFYVAVSLLELHFFSLSYCKFVEINRSKPSKSIKIAMTGILDVAAGPSNRQGLRLESHLF